MFQKAQMFQKTQIFQKAQMFQKDWIKYSNKLYNLKLIECKNKNV